MMKRIKNYSNKSGVIKMFSTRNISIFFLFFFLSVFIGCSNTTGTLTSNLSGEGVVAGKAIVRNSDGDNSNIVITLEPDASSTTVMAAAERYPRQARMAPGFQDTLAKKLASSSSTTLQTSTNSNGDFTLSQVPSGTYIVKAHKVNYVQQNKPQVDVKPEQVSTVNVELDTPGKICGSVKLQDETNNAGIIVYIKNAGFTITDDKGNFSFDSLEEGTYEITAKEYGYKTFTTLVSVEKGKTKDLGEIELNKIASLSVFGAIAGEVRAQNMVPIQSVEVNIVELPQFKAYTSNTGNFLFENLPAGKYTLRFEYQFWVKEVKDVYVQSKQQTSMEPVYFDLTKPEYGILKGRIMPIAPSMVSVQKDGVEITSKMVNDGNFSFALDPGSYDIVVISAGYITNNDAKGIIINKGEETGKDITLLPAPGKFMGTVNDNDGNPIAGVTVSAGEIKTTTGDSGNFVLENVQPGNYTLRFSKTGYKIFEENEMTLISGENKSIGNVTLEKLPKNSLIQSVNLDYSPGNMKVDGSLLYVIDSSHDLIHIYDIVSMKEEGSFKVGRNPQFIDIDDNYIYTANKWSNNVGIYRKSNGSLYKNIETGLYPISFVKDGDNLFVANYGDNTVVMVSLTNFQTLKTFSTESGPVRLALNNGKLYILNQISQSLQVFGIESGDELEKISVGLEATDMVKSSNALVIANSGSSNITSIDLSNDSIANTISIQTTPKGICMVDDNAYITAYDSGFLFQISPLTLSIVDSVSLGNGINSMAFDNDSGILFIASDGARRILLVNGR